MKNILNFLIILALLVENNKTCKTQDKNPSKTTGKIMIPKDLLEAPELDVTKLSLRFFVIGDWGGLPVPPYSTLAQRTVASAMLTMGNEENTHFQVGVGDNIYMVGVRENRLSRLQLSFENVYNNTGALAKPWYMIAGNHDHYGHVHAQMKYTDTSDRWVFPNYKYTIRYRIANGIRIDIVMIDTVILCGNTAEGTYKSAITYATAKKDDRMTKGPKYPDLAKQHWKWIDNELAKSDADYLFVAGHYPVYSIGEHGPTQCLIDELRPRLHKHQVNAYFCGHDHSLQHLNETYKGWTVHHILSGAGAFEFKSDKGECRIDSSKVCSQYFYPKSQGWQDVAGIIGRANGGFVYAKVGIEKAEFLFVSGILEKEHPVVSYPTRKKYVPT